MESKNKLTYKKVVVTGASGFLGGRVLKGLTEKYPDIEFLGTGRRSIRKAEFEKIGCNFLAGDLTDESFCKKLLVGVDAVIHCAALSSPWGTYDQFYQANVKATEYLLNISKTENCKRFVFIATPSVYFNYKERWKVKESDPLPKKLVNAYAVTKLEAEKMVLDLNTPDFQTVALRPRAIVGAEDTVIMPRVLHAYEMGKLKIIGDGKNKVDLTAVANVIHAVDCCLQAPDNAMGESYNITNDEAIYLWEEINEVLKGLGLQPVSKKVPFWLANLVAYFSEKLAVFNGNKEPALTQYGIGILAMNFTMDVNKAKEKLGYQPKFSTRDAVLEFVDWYKNNKA